MFSGGGARIHYHAGAALYLLGEAAQRYDMYCGVSAGAITATFLAQYKWGEEHAAAEAAFATISQLRASDVLRRWWPFGRLSGLWKPSLYSSAPLRQLVYKHLDMEKVRHSDKKLYIGAVDVASGSFTTFDKHATQLQQAVLASMAFPGFLEPVELQGKTYIDGGVRVVTPLGAAIMAGATDVDVVIASPADPELEKDTKLNAIQIAARALELMSNEIMEKDLKLARAYNQVARDAAMLCKLDITSKRYVNIRVIRPAKHVGITSFDFDSPRLTDLRRLGYSDAASAASVVK